MDRVIGGGALAAALLAVAGVLALLYRTVIAANRTWRRVQDFLDDWRGEPARPGVPARQGIMARLEWIEQRVAMVEREVRPNGGRSLKDQVTRIETAISDGPE